MAAAPPAAAAGDLLYCLGLGLALGAVRDVCGLVLGRGRLRNFFCDVAAFACAAVLVCGFAAGASASGVPRWYMALGLLAGALGPGGRRCPARCTAPPGRWGAPPHGRCAGPQTACVRPLRAVLPPGAAKKQKRKRKEKEIRKKCCKRTGGYCIINSA